VPQYAKVKWAKEDKPSLCKGTKRPGKKKLSDELQGGGRTERGLAGCPVSEEKNHSKIRDKSPKSRKKKNRVFTK